MVNYKNLLLGIAIGDAFGAGVEFQDRDWIEKNVDFTQFVNARHLINVSPKQLVDFVKNYRVWDYTDDTEMTIGGIKALLSNRPLTPDLLVYYWKQEFLADKKRKGFGRNGHGSMRWFYEGSKNIQEIRSFQKVKKYPGNAPTMRAIPFGLVPEKLIDKYAIMNADATHPHDIARAASILIARATHFLLMKKGNPNNLISYCFPFIKGLDQETYFLLKEVNQLPTPNLLKEEGYVLLGGPQPIQTPRFLAGIKGMPSDAMLTAVTALYLLKYSNNAFAGLKRAILMGGDVDSLASIVTGILAGKYGVKSLPKYMLENVEGKDYLVGIANKMAAAKTIFTR